MTLAEVLISSVVLASSSSAALGVWSQAVGEMNRAKQLEDHSLQLETLRISTHRWLESGVSSTHLLEPMTDECRFAGVALDAAASERLVLGPDTSSRWTPDPSGLGHWLELTVQTDDETSPLMRRQLFTPAAYGLCQSDEARR